MNAFVYPVDANGTFYLAEGDKINLACPEGDIYINNVNTTKEMVQAKCHTGLEFYIDNNNKTDNFNTIKCSMQVPNLGRYTGAFCPKTNYKEIEIGVVIKNRFIRHILACFDTKLQHIAYTVQTLSSLIAGSQVGYPRPGNFKGSNFFNVPPGTAKYYYSKKGQRESINKILGLAANDTSVIQENSNYYLSIGHYAAKSDFIYGVQQKLTFYYVNAAPQWQTFNGGNWNTMEKNCRSLADQRKIDLTIYTGSYGVATLPDIKKQEKELYLWVGANNETGIPVPRLFYRVVYEPISQAGVVVLGLNNPYKKKLYPGDVICTDICKKVKWLTWIKTDYELGYSYCCEVDDFRKRVNYLPDFTVKSILV